MTYPVQINGKVRGRVEVAADAPEETVRAAALAAVASALAGKEPRKVIVVKGRMVSSSPDTAADIATSDIPERHRYASQVYRLPGPAVRRMWPGSSGGWARGVPSA